MVIKMLIRLLHIYDEVKFGRSNSLAVIVCAVKGVHTGRDCSGNVMMRDHILILHEL